MDLVEMILRSQPSEDDWRKMAGQNPKQFAEALRIISQLAGFHEKMTVDHNHAHFAVEIAQMSDSQLLEAYEENQRSLGFPAKGANHIELEAMPEGEKLGKVG